MLVPAIARKGRTKMARGDQKKLARALSKSNVIVEDISGIESCPKCEGILRWAEDTRYEDAVACICCGWRPSAKLEMEMEL